MMNPLKEKKVHLVYITNLQFNKRFNNQLSSYIAIKNIINYTQESPIIDPGNPFGDDFDTAYAYGPMQGRRFVLELVISCDATFCLFIRIFIYGFGFSLLLRLVNTQKSFTKTRHKY